jgi:hypothetical protein
VTEEEMNGIGSGRTVAEEYFLTRLAVLIVTLLEAQREVPATKTESIRYR